MTDPYTYILILVALDGTEGAVHTFDTATEGLRQFRIASRAVGVYWDSATLWRDPDSRRLAHCEA